MQKKSAKHVDNMFFIIMSLAWPTMLEQLMQTAVQYIDTAMVGSLGTQATAAVGATTTVGWLIGGMVSAWGVGFLSFIAQACGAKNRDAAAKAVKEVEQRMSDLSLLIKHTTTYRQLKPIYDEYRKSPDKEKYLRGHESEIILFEAAARALKEMQIKKLPDLAALRKEYRSLNDRKTKLYEDYRQAKKQMQEYGVVKKTTPYFF